MARTRKSIQPLNLHKFDVLIEDRGTRSDYFKVTQFDGYFYGGRNAFLIAGSNILTPNTSILVEVLNSNGDTVYSAPVATFIEGGSRLVKIEVYEDTPIGPGKLVILGSVDAYIDGTPIPQEWKGKYNIRWITDVIISPLVKNKTPIRFEQPPTMTVTEKFYSAPSSSQYTEIVQIPISVELSPKNFNIFQNGYLLNLTGSTNGVAFKSEYVGGKLTGSITFSGELGEESVVVDLPITKIYNNTIAETQGSIVKTNKNTIITSAWLRQSGSYSSSINSQTVPVIDSDIKIIYSKLETLSTGSGTSFAEIRIVDLETFSGEIDKVRLSYKKSTNPGEFIFIGDIDTQVTELLTIDSGSSIVNTGDFNKIKLDDYWYAATMSLSKNDVSITLPSYYVSSSLINNELIYTNSADIIDAISATPVIVNGTFVDEKSYFIGTTNINYVTLFPRSEYTLAFNALASRTSGAAELQQDDYSLEVYLVEQEDGNSRILTTDVRGQLIGTLTPSSAFKKQNFERVNFNFVPKIKTSGKYGLRFIVYGGHWSIANVSIKPSEENLFSPDEINALLPIQNNEQDILTFKAEFLDVNNNTAGVSTFSIPTYFTGSSDYVKKAGDEMTGELFIKGLPIQQQALQDSFTGLVSGGLITVNTPASWSYTISSGSGYVIDNYTDPLNPTYTYVQWPQITKVPGAFLTVGSIAEYPRTNIAISASGEVIEQSAEWTALDYRKYIILGRIAHVGTTFIQRALSLPLTTYNRGFHWFDLANAIGILNVEGNVFFPSGSSMRIGKTAGKTYRVGSNYRNDTTFPDITTDPSASAVQFAYRYRSGSGFKEEPLTTFITGTLWDNGSGVLQTINPNKFTIQRIYYFGATNTTRIQFGQNVYDTLVDAQSATDGEVFVADPNLERDSSLRTYLIVGSSATNLSNPNQAEFITIGKFGAGGTGGGGGGGGATALSGLTDVNLSGIAIGDILRYNGTVWVNAASASITVATSSLALIAHTSSYAITSSYPFAISGSTIYSTETPKANFSPFNSLLIGEEAGVESTDSYNSIFIGPSAGTSASNSDQSVFIGSEAGRVSTNSRYAVIIGAEAGESAEDIGYSVAIGRSAGRFVSMSSGNVLIGDQAGAYTTQVYNTNAIGFQAGSGITNSVGVNAIGAYAGLNASAWQATFIGFQAGAVSTVSHSLFVGENAGYKNDASYSTFIGYYAGASDSFKPKLGNNNIIIGTNITLPENRTDSINIGGILFGTGSHANILLTDPYSGSVGNGRIGINIVNPQHALHVSGSILASNGITGSLFGTSSWAASSSVAISASWAPAVGLSGGTTNYIPLWTGTGTLSSSVIFQSAGNVGIGTITPGTLLDISATGATARVLGTGGTTPRFILSSAGVSAWSFRVSGSDSSFRLDQDGTDRITVLNGGNVGIGTTTPSYRLSVQGAVEVRSAGAVHWRDGANSSFTSIFNNSGAMVFETAFTERVRIDSTGNIGIGTTSPVSKLDINQTLGNTLALNLFGSTTTGQSFGQRIYAGTNSSDYALSIRDRNDTLSYLYVRGDGNVGIGTNTPGQLLQLGNANTSANLLRLSLGYDTSRTTRAGIEWHDTSNTTARISTEFDGALVSLQFGSLYNAGYNSNTIMTLRGNGNVGIGITTPAHRLDVSGSTRLGVGGDRPTVVNTSGLITTQGDVGGWAFGHHALGSSGTDRGGFGFYGDGNNLNYYYIGADYITPTMVIQSGSTGRVGIGTTNPTQKLEVIGNALIGQKTNSSTPAFLNITAGGSGFDSIIDLGFYDTFDAGVWYLKRHGADNSFRIANAGTGAEVPVVTVSQTNNVGIGTTSPLGNLHVSGANATRIALIGGSTRAVRIGADTTAAYVEGVDQTGVGSYQPLYVGGSTTSLLTGGTERWRVDSSGNLIAVLDNSYDIGGSGVTRPRSVYVATSAIIGNDPGGSEALRVGGASRLSGDIFLAHTGVATITTVNNQPLRLGTNNVFRVHIGETGNVGIGTATPGNTLHVQGNVSASSYTSSLNNQVGFFGTASFAVSSSWANTVSANSLSGTTLASNVVASSLTSVGTLSSLTMNGTVAMQDNQITRPRLTDYAETYTTATISGNALTLNIENGNVFRTTLNANINTGSFAISNPSPTGTACSFTLIFDANGTGYAVNWPTAVKWPGGTAPTLTTTNGRSDMFVFYTNNAGTTWYAMTAGQNFVTT